MKKYIIVILIALFMLTASSPWNFVKTKFKLIMYNADNERGGAEVADYDSSSIIIDSENTFLKFFDSIGDSGRISFGLDTMFFNYASVYDFDGNINFRSDSLVITGDNPTISVIDSSSIVGNVQWVVCTDINYTNTSTVNLKSLPANAVFWKCYVKADVLFNGSGTDVVKVGTVADDDHYATIPVSSNTAFQICTTNYPEKYSATTQLTCIYVDQNSDASAGEARIFIFYTLF